MTPDPQAVLTAVRALHKAFVARDMKAISSALRPGFESMQDAKELGSFDGMMAQFEQSLKGEQDRGAAGQSEGGKFLRGALISGSGRARACADPRRLHQGWHRRTTRGVARTGPVLVLSQWGLAAVGGLGLFGLLAVAPSLGPAFLGELTRSGYGQRAGGHIFGDAGAGADVGSVLDGHRRDQR